VTLPGQGSARSSYDALAEAWEAEFARNRQLHGDRIQCRTGCDACCSQLFQITEIEAAVVSEGVRALAPDVRARVQARAMAYLPERARLVAQHGMIEGWGSLPPEGTRLACPALESGACQIYTHRPLICRKFGVPLWNPDRPGRVHACELNFKAGEEIEDGKLIQIQTALHNNWKATQMAYNAAGGRRDPQPITVARAVLEDFTMSGV
jgi:Fe-S-cluster containining protein